MGLAATPESGVGEGAELSDPLEVLHWRSVAVSPGLGAGDLHLWKLDCGPLGPSLQTQWHLLSEGERSRAQRLRQEHHRERYVRAHAGLRTILSFYTNNDPHLHVFDYGSAGKPILVNQQSGLEFNMTTSDDMALVAVSSGCPVGIDCERVRPRADLLPIARRMFRQAEAERIASAPEERRLELFYRSWTALEADVKADGRGLSRRRNTTSVAALGVAHCLPAPGFIAAVARASLPGVHRWQTLQLAEPQGNGSSRADFGHDRQ
jgi:4'-phosphopantetheinyl transferase